MIYVVKEVIFIKKNQEGKMGKGEVHSLCMVSYHMCKCKFVVHISNTAFPFPIFLHVNSPVDQLHPTIPTKGNNGQKPVNIELYDSIV